MSIEDVTTPSQILTKLLLQDIKARRHRRMAAKNRMPPSMPTQVTETVVLKDESESRPNGNQIGHKNEQDQDQLELRPLKGETSKPPPPSIAVNESR